MKTAKASKLMEWWAEIKLHKNKILLSLIFLVFSAVINSISGNYASRVASKSSTDLILDIIPPMDLTFFFVYVWFLILLFLFLYPLFAKVHKFHEVIYHVSLIYLVRSVFITLTHLKSPSDIVSVTFPWPFNKLAFEHDLFFSGHTATPLVGFFVFGNSRIRYFFLGLSLLMAFTVLAMHQHYSIDVFAAYFIAYGTFHIGEWLTRKAKEMHVKYF